MIVYRQERNGVRTVVLDDAKLRKEAHHWWQRRKAGYQYAPVINDYHW